MARPRLDPLVLHLGGARVAQRLTQSEVARRMHLAESSRNWVSVLELGRHSPSLGTLRCWTRALGFDLALVPYRPEAPDATAALMEQLEQLLAELDRLRTARCASCKGDE